MKEKKITLRQMADEMSEYYKTNNVCVQITIVQRTILRLDYSVPVHRKEYGIAPVHVSKCDAKYLRREYYLMKKKQQETTTNK